MYQVGKNIALFFVFWLVLLLLVIAINKTKYIDNFNSKKRLNG